MPRTSTGQRKINSASRTIQCEKIPRRRLNRKKLKRRNKLQVKRRQPELVDLHQVVRLLVRVNNAQVAKVNRLKHSLLVIQVDRIIESEIEIIQIC